MADATDAFRAGRKTIEAKVNELLSKEILLPEIEKWAFIAIIRDTDKSTYDEVIKSSGRGKNLEFRLKAPYEQFKNGNDVDRISLIFGALLRSVEKMSELGAQAEDSQLVADLLFRAKQQLKIG